MVMVAKLTMRPNDTSKGRANKLANYIDLHKRLVGGIPPDVHLFVRNPADIPLTMKDEVTVAPEAPRLEGAADSRSDAPPAADP